MATRSLSVEDGNLGKANVSGSRIREYKDIDLSFEPKPGSPQKRYQLIDLDNDSAVVSEHLFDQDITYEEVLSHLLKVSQDSSTSFTVPVDSSHLEEIVALGGDIFKKTNAAAVKQSVKNLILTNNFEKPFQPFFGADIQNYLFEFGDPETLTQIKDNIESAIKNYEPRAEIIKLEVSPYLLQRTPRTGITTSTTNQIVEFGSDDFNNTLEDNNTINVYLEFKVINTEEIVIFTTTLSRLR